MHFSITTKIFMGLAIVVLTFGLVSAYAVVQMRHIGRNLELTSRTYLPLSKLASQLDTIHSNRTRDNNRLLEEQETRIQSVLISIARRHHPKLVREQIILGMDISRSGRARAYEAGEAMFLLEVEDIFRKLESLYEKYDGIADSLYRIIEEKHSNPDHDPKRKGQMLIAEEMRQLEREIERTIKDLGLSLEEKVTERVRRTESEERRVTLTIIIMSLAALLVAVAVSLFVQRTIKPIGMLTRGVKDVREGNFAQRIDVKGKDEISELAREFNEMAKALSDRDSKLAIQRTALLRAERLAAIGKLAAQISHEVRNPLSSIGLNTELMIEELAVTNFDDPARAGEVRSLLNAISSEVDRLTEITEDYLRFARMPGPNLEPENINVIVNDVLAFVHPEMTAAGIELKTEPDNSLPEAMADEGQLRQALLNLLRNAREALAGKPGIIRIKTGYEKNRIFITVSDNGPGIAPEEADKIFEPFVTSKKGGTGLGLSLTQQIMTEHKGNISFESSPGQGARFTLELVRAG